jgi:hypothetical protein
MDQSIYKDMNVYQRMNLVMNKVKYIKKREKKSGMFYSFVSHDDVSALFHDPIAESGLHIISTVESYSIEQRKVNKWDKNANQYREVEEKTHTLTLKVEFVNIDKPSDKITVIGWGYALDNEDKGYGKAMSYALKYVLLKTFLLESGDEDEIDAYQEDPKASKAQKTAPKPIQAPPPPAIPRVTKAQADNIKALINGDEILKADVIKFTGVNMASDIAATKYDSVLKIIASYKAQEGVA